MWALSLALELLTSYSLIAPGTWQAQNVHGIFLKKKKKKKKKIGVFYYFFHIKQLTFLLYDVIFVSKPDKVA